MSIRKTLSDFLIDLSATKASDGHGWPSVAVTMDGKERLPVTVMDDLVSMKPWMARIDRLKGLAQAKFSLCRGGQK